MWRTGGSECYNRLRPQLNYPNSDVFVVVFSAVNPACYSNVTNNSIPEVKRYKPNTPIVFVGNQIDMRIDPDYLKQLAKQNEKHITTEMEKKLAREINAAAYVESSCLEIVEILFEKSTKISQNMPMECCDNTPSLYILIIGDSDVEKLH